MNQNAAFDIRPASANHLPQIGRLLVATWRSAFRGILDDAYLDAMSAQEQAAQQARRMSIPGVSYRVAIHQRDGIIGLATFGPAREDIPPHIQELYSLYVAPGQQRQGVGTALVRAMAERCRASDVEAVFAWTLRDNPHREFYEKCGAWPSRTGTVHLAGRTYAQTAYLWDDISTL